MPDYRESIREHLAASKKRLEKGHLTATEADALRKKIKGLSVLLDATRKPLEKETRRFRGDVGCKTHD